MGGEKLMFWEKDFIKLNKNFSKIVVNIEASIENFI